MEKAKLQKIRRVGGGDDLGKNLGQKWLGSKKVSRLEKNLWVVSKRQVEIKNEKRGNLVVSMGEK